MTTRKRFVPGGVIHDEHAVSNSRDYAKVRKASYVNVQLIQFGL
jgi:hypothetical protein